MTFASSQVSVAELMGRAENRFPYRENIQLPLTWKRNFPDRGNNQETQETEPEGVWPTWSQWERLPGKGGRCWKQWSQM